MRCRIIDVVLPVGSARRSPGGTAGGRGDEPGDTSVVAYRGPHRWIQSLEPAPLATAPEIPVLRRRGVYVITGGRAGLGLVIARNLAETVARARADRADSCRRRIRGLVAWGKPRPTRPRGESGVAGHRGGPAGRS